MWTFTKKNSELLSELIVANDRICELQEKLEVQRTLRSGSQNITMTACSVADKLDAALKATMEEAMNYSRNRRREASKKE